MKEIASCLGDLGPTARVAVLPQGPLTIPYLVGGAGELKKAA